MSHPLVLFGGASAASCWCLVAGLTQDDMIDIIRESVRALRVYIDFALSPLAALPLWDVVMRLLTYTGPN